MSAFVILTLFALLSFAIRKPYLLKPFAIVGLLISIVLSSLGHGVPLSGFEATPAMSFFEVIVFIVMIAVVLNEEENINITQSLFIAAASTLLLEAQSILAFVIAFEALSLLSIILVAHIKTPAEADGAIKIFIAGAIATALIFLGITLYSFDGHSILEPLQTPLTAYGEAGVWIILLAVFYKLTIVPMHSWAADSYANIAPSHAAILSAIAKSVAAVALFNVFEGYLSQAGIFNAKLLIIFALITMTLGNFLALFSQRLTKIFAYSSIAQAGYLLLAFVTVKSQYASSGVLYMAVAYIFMQSSVFLIVSRLGKMPTQLTLENIKGLSSQNKLLSLFLTIQLFSLAGIPLLAGFLGKAVLFYAVVDAGFYIVALIALLNSALSVGYYAWIIKQLYFEEQNTPMELQTTKSSMVAQSILLIGTLYFGVFAYSVFVYA